MDQVSVANLALGWLGLEAISSFDDQTRVAAILKDQFPGLRDAVLEDRNWTFATARLQVQKAAAPPAFGYSSQYQLPATVLRVITAAEADATTSLDAFAASMTDADVSDLDWAKEGRLLLANTDAAKLNVKAIVQVEDSALWSPGFCQALAARIAADLCNVLTHERELEATHWKLYERKLQVASGNDARQGRSQRLRPARRLLRRG